VKVGGERLSGIVVGNVLDVAEVRLAAAGLGEPVDGLADLLLAEFRLPGHDASRPKGVMERGKTPPPEEWYGCKS
jgi:hypothetical protein